MQCVYVTQGCCHFYKHLIITIDFLIHIPATNYFIVCWKLHTEEHSLNVLLRIVLRFVIYFYAFFNGRVGVELMKLK